jgi:hypothetical protein
VSPQRCSSPLPHAFFPTFNDVKCFGCPYLLNFLHPTSSRSSQGMMIIVFSCLILHAFRGYGNGRNVPGSALLDPPVVSRPPQLRFREVFSLVPTPAVSCLLFLSNLTCAPSKSALYEVIVILVASTHRLFFFPASAPSSTSLSPLPANFGVAMPCLFISRHLIVFHSIAGCRTMLALPPVLSLLCCTILILLVVVHTICGTATAHTVNVSISRFLAQHHSGFVSAVSSSCFSTACDTCQLTTH